MKTIIFCILLMLGAQLGIAQTNVSGIYFSNTNWTAAGSPYNVTGDVQIPAGVTLNIAPGVLINYSGNYEILIKGTILAIGKSSSRIIFNGTASGKAMLIFKNANLSNSLINFVYFSGPKSGAEIEFGNTGTLLIKNAIIGNTTIKTNGLSFPQDSLIIDSSYLTTTSILEMQTSIEIKNSTITRSDIFSNSVLRFFTIRTCLVDSIILKGGAHLIVSSNVKRSKVFSEVSSLNIIDSKIERTSIYPVFLRVINSEIKDYDTVAVIGRGVIECSTLSGTGNGVGIIVTGNGSMYGALTIRNSTIKQNRIGIIINPNWPDTSFIDSSNFVSNTIYNIQNFSPASINSKHNWWGTTDSAVIKNKIYDYYDNINSGIVNFGNRLNSIYTSSGCPGPQSQGINVCNSNYISINDTINHMKINFYPIMPDGPTIKFLWSFGDSTSSTLYSPSHIYSSYAVYNVCLSVTKTLNGDTCHVMFCKPVTVGCASDFQYFVSTSNPGTVSFVNYANGLNRIYNWNFGDSTYSSLANPTKTYSKTGIYNVCLKLTSSTDTNCFQTKCRQVYVQVPTPCISNFVFIRDDLNSKKIRFYSKSTGDSLSYTWYLGDGDTAYGKNPEHTYNDTGNYTVCLSINSLTTLCYAATCHQVFSGTKTVWCQANFSAGYSQTSRTLTVDNQSIGIRLKYIWSFGDGDTSYLKNPIHTYTSPGIYQLCLYAADSVDIYCAGLSCRNITFDPPPGNCNADFTFLPDSIGYRYAFYPKSKYTDSTCSFIWTFGDGDSSMIKNPNHIYQVKGKYTVCLFISNPGDTCYKITCNELNILSGIEKIASLRDVKFYPNPFNESIQIELTSAYADKLNVRFFDIQGRECHKENFNLLPAANHFTIDTGDLAKGIYIVKLNTSKQYHFIKLIKQ